MTPYEDIINRINAYAGIYGFDDFLVTIDLAGTVTTQLLLCDNGDLEWASDWWEGEYPVKLLGFIPVSHIKIYASSVEIGRPVFGPDPSDFSSRPIGCNSEHHVACRSCTDPMRGMYAHCPLYPTEVIPDGTP